MLANSSKLQANILAGHKSQDAARLCEQYAEASILTIDLDEACFHATHAYILALQSGHHLKEELHRFLMRDGREE